MRLPRFRLRPVMIAVAVAALVMGGWSMWNRSERFSRIGWQHQIQINILASYPSPIADAVRWRQQWHADLAAKYFAAARYPWLPVPPDPPPPEVSPDDGRHTL